MTLTRSFIRNAVTTPLDARLMNMASIVCNADGSPRTGVLGAANASIVSTTAGMTVNVAAAEFATSKGKADGVSIFTNDGTVAVTITAAPVSNSRIDVIWVKHNDNTTGDADSLPVFGVTAGTAAASPTKPAIPTGALELATLRIFSGTTATNGGSNVLTNTYQMTVARGAIVPFRTKTEIDGWTTAPALQRAQSLATGIIYEYNSGAWRQVTYTQTVKVGLTALTNAVLTTAVTVNLPADSPIGTYLVHYTVVTDAGSVGSRFHRVLWAGVELTDYTNDVVSNAPIGGLAASDTLTKVGHTGGVASVSLQVQVNASSPIFRYARITVLYVGP